MQFTKLTTVFLPPSHQVGVVDVLNCHCWIEMTEKWGVLSLPFLPIVESSLNAGGLMG